MRTPRQRPIGTYVKLMESDKEQLAMEGGQIHHQSPDEQGEEKARQSPNGTGGGPEQSPDIYSTTGFDKAEEARRKAEEGAKKRTVQEREFWYGPVTLLNAVERQKEWAQRLNAPIQKQSNNGLSFMLIPPGEFKMGSEGWPDSLPLHNIRITKAFYMGVYPVTQREWQKLMGTNPSHFKGKRKKGIFSSEEVALDSNPVESVSWYDAREFIKRLNRMEGTNRYRLPTEAEWEYACRSGSEMDYCYGNQVNELGNYAWYYTNSGGKTHPVGSKKPNVWGLYDMHGNVCEWCRDWYSEDYYRECEEEGEVKDPEGPGAGSRRVFRGGSWNLGAGGCTAGSRIGFRPGGRGGILGYRLARSLP